MAWPDSSRGGRGFWTRLGVSSGAGLFGLQILWLQPAPAAAQLRSVSVPAEAGIVVAPRGRSVPRLAAAPHTSITAETAAPVQAAPAAGLFASPWIGALLPVAAAALLGSTLAGGGGGGGSGPVRTR